MKWLLSKSVPRQLFLHPGAVSHTQHDLALLQMNHISISRPRRVNNLINERVFSLTAQYLRSAHQKKIQLIGAVWVLTQELD